MNSADILTMLDNPRELEKLYRDNKAAFKTTFNLLYPQLKHHPLAAYWHERLNYETVEISWGNRKEVTFAIIAALVAGCIAKLPALLQLDPESFYQRNAGFIIFPVLTTYFIWRMQLSTKKIILAGAALLLAVVFINLLPADNASDSLVLSCIHLPLFLWAVLGFSYAGDNTGSYGHRLSFLRYNGDLVIMTTLLVIAGAILTGITIGLFSVIGFKIEKFYFDYIGIFGLAALPVAGTYITQNNPQLVNKVSPVIAKIFSPLVLIMLVVYLTAIIFSNKDPYKDRDFLMVFNFLLIGVMAIILFSVASASKQHENRAGNFILLALSIVTVIVNSIALSAIVFRMSAWGITPNRLAVSGANILILVNLCIVAYRLFKHLFKKAPVSEVENAISMFLPVYIIWTVIVTFIFPFVFHFK